MHAGSMALVPMERWLNSDQFKKKESLKRSKIDRFRAFFVLTTTICLRNGYSLVVAGGGEEGGVKIN